MPKQATSYPLRLPPHLREFYQGRAVELDRSLHWVLVKTLDEVAKAGEAGAEEVASKEKAPNANLGG
jgi:hypothetical protein